MSTVPPELTGRYGAHKSWANTPDRSARTAPARAKSTGSDEYWVEKIKANPKFAGATAEQITAAADSAKRAHFAELSMKAVRARQGGDAA